MFTSFSLVQFVTKNHKPFKTYRSLSILNGPSTEVLRPIPSMQNFVAICESVWQISWSPKINHIVGFFQVYPKWWWWNVCLISVDVLEEFSNVFLHPKPVNVVILCHCGIQELELYIVMIGVVENETFIHLNKNVMTTHIERNKRNKLTKLRSYLTRKWTNGRCAVFMTWGQPDFITQYERGFDYIV